MSQVTRRDFLRLVGISCAGLVILPKVERFSLRDTNWPEINLNALPLDIKKILEKPIQCQIDNRGELILLNADYELLGKAPLVPTQWNQENKLPSDRLSPDRAWGIVLHWYGDRGNFAKTLDSYLGGFNSLRQIEDYITRTSAHFLVGDTEPEIGDQYSPSQVGIGIVQLQEPDEDGTPYVASHLGRTNYIAHENGDQYFVRAVYELMTKYPTFYPVLLDIFDGPQSDPNEFTIAIELTDYGFDKPFRFPLPQKITNVVELVWALMERYEIPAINVLGHHEIDLGKADPGKKFIALIRFLIGLRALVHNSPRMNSLVFGPFMEENSDGQDLYQAAVARYFMYIRDYMVLVSSPAYVYEWEALSQFWFVYDSVSGIATETETARIFCSPLPESGFERQGVFCDSENRGGIIMYLKEDQTSPAESTFVELMAAGTCVYIGPSKQWGKRKKVVIFRHRQCDGSEILSIYDNLDGLGDIGEGQSYPIGYNVGEIARTDLGYKDFLYFAIAYGATWDTVLSESLRTPLNAGPTWLRNHYLDPIKYLEVRSNLVPVRQKEISRR
jgi:hypothetical protein